MLRLQGIETRATFDDSDQGVIGAKMAAVNTAAAVVGAPHSLEPGRVILAVPDASMVEFFRQQFSQLPAPVELVPALGVENCIALVQQALQMGGLDCVLLHPEFLRDKSPSGLVNCLHAANQRCIAFGWAPLGPMRELVETSGVDGWLEGPSFGAGINLQQLMAVLVRVQQFKKQQAMMMRE